MIFFSWSSLNAGSIDGISFTLAIWPKLFPVRILLWRIPSGNASTPMPEGIRQSKILTGNNLGQIANVNEMPFIDPAFNDDQLKNIIQYFAVDPGEMEKELHRYAKKLLDEGKVPEAWQVLLALS